MLGFNYLNWVDDVAVRAYILGNVKVGKLRRIVEEIKELDGVVSVSVTAGVFDFIVRVEVDSLEKLFELTESIHEIEGVERTNTHVVEFEIP